jgi:agmatine deiminase
MPAEWEPHAGTWLAWPHAPATWPGHLEEARREYTEFVRALQGREPVRLLVGDDALEDSARRTLAARGVDPERGIEYLRIPTNDSWLRDTGPIVVEERGEGGVRTRRAIAFGFNAWGGKYPPWNADDEVPTRIAEELKLPVFYPGIVMEGGAVDFNGAGTVMTTMSCLLNKNRNPGLSQARIEKYLRDYYGQKHVIWLGDGIEGDDTDGHIDDLARFIDERTIAIALEGNTLDPNYKILKRARQVLDQARDQDGRPFTIVELPMPRPLSYEGQRVPATYVNFYFANRALLVPTFGHPARDRQAIRILAKHLPGREVIGVDCRALIWGLGAIHCFTQQQPKF